MRGGQGALGLRESVESGMPFCAHGFFGAGRLRPARVWGAPEVGRKLTIKLGSASHSLQIVGALAPQRGAARLPVGGVIGSFAALRIPSPPPPRGRRGGYPLKAR